jgi:hypothetical protein
LTRSARSSQPLPFWQRHRRRHRCGRSRAGTQGTSHLPSDCTGAQAQSPQGRSLRRASTAVRRRGVESGRRCTRGSRGPSWRCTRRRAPFQASRRRSMLRTPRRPRRSCSAPWGTLRSADPRRRYCRTCQRAAAWAARRQARGALLASRASLVAPRGARLALREERVISLDRRDGRGRRRVARLNGLRPSGARNFAHRAGLRPIPNLEAPRRALPAHQVCAVPAAADQLLSDGARRRARMARRLGVLGLAKRADGARDALVILRRRTRTLMPHPDRARRSARLARLRAARRLEEARSARHAERRRSGAHAARCVKAHPRSARRIALVARSASSYATE